MENENKKLGQHPAYPCEYEGGEYDDFGMPIIAHRKYYGMSQRLLIAKDVLTGIVSNPFFNIGDFTDPSKRKAIVRNAIEFTDELLKQENE